MKTSPSHLATPHTPSKKPLFASALSLWALALAYLMLSLVVLKLDSMLKVLLSIDIAPFMLIALLGLCALLLAIKGASSQRKVLASILSIFPICLALGEGYGLIMLHSKISKECHMQTSGTYAKDYFKTSFITGYKATSSTQVNAIKSEISEQGSRLIYDVRYTINADSWRIVPSSADSDVCLLFFGDSFTIGEGLEDTQTLPYYMGKHIHARIYNFGFHGYGPHQALALLQSGEVKRIITRDDKIHTPCKKVLAIYESLPSHIQRAAGFSPWEDNNAPRFHLAQASHALALTQSITNTNAQKIHPSAQEALSIDPSALTVIWSNQYKHPLLATLLQKLQAQIKKSYLFQVLTPHYEFSTQSNALYLAIIHTMQAELAAQFHAPLFLLLWDSENSPLESKQTAFITQALHAIHIPYMLASTALETNLSFDKGGARYVLDICDMHPNASANAKLASFLSTHLPLH